MKDVFIVYDKSCFYEIVILNYFMSYTDCDKEHYISFLEYASDGVFDMVKLYPEGNAEARFKIRGSGRFYCYCNRHGLYTIKTLS